MKLKYMIPAALLLAPAHAWAMVDSYSAGAAKLSVKEDGAEVEIREANAPGQSIRVYVSPGKVGGTSNCMGVPPLIASGYFPSDVTAAAAFVSPIAGYLANVTQAAMDTVLHDNPLCDAKKFGYFTVDTVKNGTAKYKLKGTLKTYLIEITFGPAPEDASKTVVLRLRTHST